MGGPIFARGPGRCRALLAGVLLTLTAGAALAQFASDPERVAELADWREGEVPPPPAYSTSGLIDIDMPAGSSVKLGVDPKTIAIDQAKGIVRYVVVMRGPTAVNASYEGIRCNTGEFRVYARQTQGNPWSAGAENDWKSLRLRSGVVVRYPYELARGGMCVGTSLPQTAADVVRELRSGNRSLYQ